MVGQPVAGRREADPPAVGLDAAGCPTSRASAAMPCETLDVVVPELGGDLVHRAEAGELEQHAGGGGRPSAIVSIVVNDVSSKVTWTRTVRAASTGDMPHLLLRRAHRRLHGRRLDALRPARPGRLRRADRRPRCGGRGLAPALLGGRSCSWSSSGRGCRSTRVRRCGRVSRSASSPPGVTLLFMAAVARLPLGTASALEFLGPLASPCGRSRGVGRAWALLAAVGVLLLTQPWTGRGRPGRRGLRARRGRLLGGVHPAHPAASATPSAGIGGLAISMPVAALVATVVAGPGCRRTAHAPSCCCTASAWRSCCRSCPFALELLALRRLTTGAFGTLMALEPAFALVIGFLVLQPGAQPARRRRHPARRGGRHRRRAHRGPGGRTRPGGRVGPGLGLTARAVLPGHGEGGPPEATRPHCPSSCVSGCAGP